MLKDGYLLLQHSTTAVPSARSCWIGSRGDAQSRMEAKPQATELPASIACIPGIEIIEVNAPQLYAKFCCQVCLREWIVPIPLEKLNSYQPPRYCRWCGSIVWANPERA